jgi:hypothetical protein
MSGIATTLADVADPLADVAELQLLEARAIRGKPESLNQTVHISEQSSNGKISSFTVERVGMRMDDGHIEWAYEVPTQSETPTVRTVDTLAARPTLDAANIEIRKNLFQLPSLQMDIDSSRIPSSSMHQASEDPLESVDLEGSHLEDGSFEGITDAMIKPRPLVFPPDRVESLSPVMPRVRTPWRLRSEVEAEERRLRERLLRIAPTPSPSPKKRQSVSEPHSGFEHPFAAAGSEHAAFLDAPATPHNLSQYVHSWPGEFAVNHFEDVAALGEIHAMQTFASSPQQETPRTPPHALHGSRTRSPLTLSPPGERALLLNRNLDAHVEEPDCPSEPDATFTRNELTPGSTSVFQTLATEAAAQPTQWPWNAMDFDDIPEAESPSNAVRWSCLDSSPMGGRAWIMGSAGDALLASP